MLNGKKILLCVSGGIAAYKAAELLRRLQDQGAEIRVAMTPDAMRFVGEMTFAALSHFPVYTSEGGDSKSPFHHIDYPRWADLILVAPCTANTLARIACGLAEEPVSLSCLAALCPVALVPAMNSAMYAATATQENLVRVRNRSSCHVLEPDAGLLACGEEGQGRFPEIPAIVSWVHQILMPPPVRGRVLVTAGRTEEAIDPVRYISNRSSGKTAVAIAEELLSSGYAVDFVHGPMDVSPPAGVVAHPVRSSVEMHTRSLELAPLCRACILCAAVADYRPAHSAATKIKDSRSLLSLELVPNPNILHDLVRRRTSGQVIIGFSLETTDATRHGTEKLERSGADFLVLNTPVREGSGFGRDHVEFCFLDRHTEIPAQPSLGSKRSLAQGVVERMSALLEAVAP